MRTTARQKGGYGGCNRPWTVVSEPHPDSKEVTRLGEQQTVWHRHTNTHTHTLQTDLIWTGRSLKPHRQKALTCATGEKKHTHTFSSPDNRAESMQRDREYICRVSVNRSLHLDPGSASSLCSTAAFYPQRKALFNDVPMKQPPATSGDRWRQTEGGEEAIMTLINPAELPGAGSGVQTTRLNSRTDSW